MNQRGFISSIYIYAIFAVAVAGLVWALKYQTERNGALATENETLVASVEWMNEQMEKQREAQALAQNLRDQAERDAVRARRDLDALRVKYEALFNLVIPSELYNRLLNSIAEANGDLPTGEPDGKVPAPIPKG